MKIPADQKTISNNLSPSEAIKEQQVLRHHIQLKPLPFSVREIKYVGGCDMSLNRFAKEGFAGFVTLDFKTMQEIDHSVSKEMINFPYIPGLLSYREIPMLLTAWKKLKIKPQVLIVDGVGIAHPRRLGIASHLGLILGIPTVGCAKSLLTGIHDEPENIPGAISYIYDKKNKNEIIGAVLRTKKNVKPIFISAGHLITLEESIEIIKKNLNSYRLPETTRLAHLTVNRYRIENTV